MYEVVVCFEVETREQAEELERGLTYSLGARMGERRAPWVPGAVLKDVVEFSVDVTAVG